MEAYAFYDAFIFFVSYIDFSVVYAYGRARHVYAAIRAIIDEERSKCHFHFDITLCPAGNKPDDCGRTSAGSASERCAAAPLPRTRLHRVSVDYLDEVYICALGIKLVPLYCRTY